MTVQECHELLQNAYREHRFVSTALLQVKAGISYPDALTVIRYAEDRGWLEEKDPEDISFARIFTEPAFAPIVLSRVKILYITRKITDTQLEFLSRHVNDQNGFTAEDVESEDMCLYLDFLLKEKLIFRIGNGYSVGIDSETIERIKAQKTS